MMTLIFDGLIVLVVLILAYQILRVEKKLRRLQSSFGAMRGLIEDFSVRVDKSKSLFEEMRTAGETVGHTLEQSMEACARQNRELRVLLAHCRRAEQRLRAASAGAAKIEAGQGQSLRNTAASSADAPTSVIDGTSADAALGGQAAPLPVPVSPKPSVRKWAPPLAPASEPKLGPVAAPPADRPEVAELLASIRNYNADSPEEPESPSSSVMEEERP